MARGSPLTPATTSTPASAATSGPCDRTAAVERGSSPTRPSPSTLRTSTSPKNPVWSPDGGSLIYTNFLQSHNDLDAISADGTDARTVVDGAHFQNKADWGTHP